MTGISTALGALPLGLTVALVINMALNWVTLMLGISVLTTLYGHLVERRPLG